MEEGSGRQRKAVIRLNLTFYDYLPDCILGRVPNEIAKKKSDSRETKVLACVSQKTRKLLGPESFSGPFSGDFLGSRKVFLKGPGIPDERFGIFFRVGRRRP